MVDYVESTMGLPELYKGIGTISGPSVHAIR